MPANPTTTAVLELNAVDNTTSVVKQVTGAVDGLKKSYGALQAVIAGLAGAIGVGYFASMIHGAIEAEAALLRLSERTGSTVEALSSVMRVAKLSGTDMDEVGKGMQKLAKAMAEAESGTGKAAKVFEALKISTTDATTGALRPAQEVMQDLGKALMGMKDQTLAVAFAQEVMGKAGANLLPFLYELARAGELQVKVTTEQAQQAKQFEDNLVRLKAASGEFWRHLANDVLPTLNKYIDQLVEGKKIFGGWWAALQEAGTTNPFASWAEQIKSINAEMDKARSKRQGMPMFGEAGDALMFGGVGTARLPVVSDAERAAGVAQLEKQRKWAQFMQRQEIFGDLEGVDTGDQNSRRFMRKTVVANPFAAGKGGATEEVKSQYDSVLKRLQDQVLATQNLTVYERTLFDIEQQRYGFLSPAQQKNLLEVARAVDTIRAQQAAEAELKRIEEERLKIYADYLASIDRAGETQIRRLTDTIAAQRQHNLEIGKSAEQIAALKSLQEAAAAAELQAQADAITGLLAEQDQDAKVIEIYTKILDQLNEQIAAHRTLSALRTDASVLEREDAARKIYMQEWKRANDEISRALTDGLMRGFESGKGFAQNFRDTLVNMFKTLILRPVISYIVQPVSGAIAAGMSGLGFPSSSSAGMGSAYSMASAGNTVSGWMGGPSIGPGSLGGMFGSGSSSAAAGASLGELGINTSFLTEASLSSAAASGIGSTAGLGVMGSAGAAYAGAMAAGEGVGAGLMAGASAGLAAMGPVGWAALAVMAIMAMSSGGGGPKTQQVLWDQANAGVGNNNITSQDPAFYSAASAFSDKIRGSYSRQQLDAANLSGLSVEGAPGDNPMDLLANIEKRVTDALGPVGDLTKATADLGAAAAEAAKAEALAAALATARRGLEIRLMDAQGNTAGVLQARRDDELAATNDLNRELLRQIYAAEDLAKATAAATAAQEEQARVAAQVEQEREAAVMTAADALRQAYQREAADLTSMIDKWKAAGDSLRAYSATLAGLGGGGASYSAASRAFGATAASARLGDLTAIGNLQTVSEKFRTASLAASATQTDYLRDIGRIQAAITDTVGVTDRQGSVAQQQLEGMRLQVSTLIDIKEVLHSTQEEMAAMRSEIAALRAAGDQTASNTAAQESFLRRISPDGNSINVTVAA